MLLNATDVLASLVATIIMKDNPDGGEGEGLEMGLPQPFVESMRTLFDILDDQHTGRVKFEGNVNCQMLRSFIG